MSANSLHRLRMVIKQMGGEPAYRVVVYGDWEKPSHADFSSRQVLLEALHSSMPDFDTSSLSFNPVQEGQGSIVFAGEVELDSRQLGLLGLADLSG